MMQAPLKSKRGAGRGEIAGSQSTAAPIKGWNTRDPLANMRAEYAITLDNWIPTAGDVSIRGGASSWATVSTATAKSVVAWKGASSEKLFAITDAGIYDCTATGPVGALVQARTNGYACSVNFNTTGGSFLVIVNGIDDLVYTNGTTWTSVATFTIGAGPATIATNLLWNINTYKRALYFINKNAMSFFYLPIDQITGAVAEFPLGGLFNKGGNLVAMGNWTIDGGTGQEDYSVFITSQGQAAVYLGTDPSSASTWVLKGIFNLAPPLGRKCFCTFGGDLLVATTRGLFSLTKVLREGRLDESGALSGTIGEAFTTLTTASYNYEGWEVIEYPKENLLIVNVPLSEYGTSYQYVMNTQTYAWARLKGWDCYSFCYFQGSLFGGFVEKVGKLFQTGQTDFGASITAEAKTAFNYFSPRSRIKSWKMVRPNLTVSGVVAINLALDTDFGTDATFGGAVFNSAPVSRWDTSQWDSAQWSSEPTPRVEWSTVAAADSYCSAMRLRVISREATVDWSATDTLYEAGSLV